MGNEWKTVGDLAASGIISLSTGPFGSALHKHEYRESGVSVVPAEAISDGELDSNKFNYIEDEKASELTRYFLESGDLVFARRGAQACGHSAYVTEEHTGAIAGTGLLFARVLNKDVLDPLFFFLVMSSAESVTWLKRHAIGATMPNLNTGIISSTPFNLIPLNQQHEIISNYLPIRNKLSLLARMNATLEAMAQALFNSWFVDFDPVIDNALAAGNPIPSALQAKAELRMLNAETNSKFKTHHSSFPSKFTWTETMGWIPEGWETGTITDLADLNSESWSNKTHPDHVNYVDLANTKNGRINEVFPYDYSEAPSRARRVLKVGDTIIGTVRPGNRSFAYIHEDGLTGSTGFAVLRPKQEACRTYVYLCLTQDDVIDYFAPLADGGAYPAIRPEVVGNFETVTFPQELMERFDQKAYPLIEKIGQHQRETDTLTKLRDTLLPKLISGELRVSDAEQVTEEALTCK